MTDNSATPTVESQSGPRIVVVGLGGAGGNAVDNMIRAKLEGVEFLVANTDAQALEQSLCEHRVQLGRGVTRGLGAGSRPEVGRTATEESLGEVLSAIEGAQMVFITAGMGGGTGTGGAPVIAQAAREAGVLAVGVVTKPFHFEGVRRMRVAEAGLDELAKQVDTLIVIPNQNLFRVSDDKATFADAFRIADEVLHSGVRGVTDLMVMPGLINLDFADIQSVMAEKGRAIMGTGESEGENRALEAAEAAISNPLLDDVSMQGARGVLINISGGLDLTLFEVDQAANRIREEVDPEANIIFGSVFDQRLEGRMRVSVVATGIDAEAGTERPKAVLSLIVSRSVEADSARKEATASPAEQIPEVPGAEAETAKADDAAATGADHTGAKPPGEAESAPAMTAPAPEEPSKTAPIRSIAPADDEATETPVSGPATATRETTAPAGDVVSREDARPKQPKSSDPSGQVGFFSWMVGRGSAGAEENFEKGDRHYYGQGVRKNLALALRSYRKAADLGHAAAQNRLGRMYETGEGVETNYNEAVKWQRRAAEQGHVNAMNDLGYMYRQGWGVTQSYSEALRWFRKAAEKYDSYAEYNMGQMYENGWGVEKDLEEGIRWFRRSAARGHEWAAKRLEELGVKT
ncbi:MAG: cell division protein FtsZ [Alphaproteobacteria bacterium]